jgi:hypothetical protein
MEDDIVYFVYGITNNKEIPLGVWEDYLPGICSELKKGGRRYNMLNMKICSIRVERRIWQEINGNITIFENKILSQRDMRRISRDK